MENLNTQHQINSNQISEEEIIAMAKDIFGTIPPWYLRNKELIEKERNEQHKFNEHIRMRIRNLLASFDHIKQ